MSNLRRAFVRCMLDCFPLGLACVGSMACADSNDAMPLFLRNRKIA